MENLYLIKYAEKQSVQLASPTKSPHKLTASGTAGCLVVVDQWYP